MDKYLSAEDHIVIFRLATGSLARFHSTKFANGMNDQELEIALKSSLGIFGGSCGPDRLSVSYQGAGLKIWGGWHIINHVQETPLFSGKETIAMAREVYDIPNPDNNQLDLFGLFPT